MRKRPYPPMVARRHEEVYSRLVSALGDKSKWLVFSCTTVALLTFVYFLGQLRAIGDSPFHAGILNACILACALLLIRFVPFRRNLGLFIFGISIISRILIFGMDPSDDVYRYIWEGRVQNAGFSPYALSPDSDQLVHLRDDNWTRINHKDKTAIYPPGASLLFRGLARFTDNPYVFKAATVAADLLTVLFILMMLRTVKRREEWALLYAVNPIVLLAFAGEGHLDAFMLAMLTGAFFLFMTRRWPWALLALAGAVHVKYVAIALVPFFIHRRTLKWSWLLPVGILLPFVFFLPGQGLFASFRTFTTTMHFNGSIHAILSCILSDYAAASVVCALAFSALILCLRMGTGSPFQNAGHVMGGLLLLSPTVHFWYLTWFIPFIVIKPTRAWILFCATIAFSFTAQAHMVAHSSWKEITWATYAVYVPVYAMLFVDLFLRRKTGSFDDGACRLPPRTVSVVVPTLNERGNLPSLFESIRNQTVVPIDIIVADGGSTDGTVEFVRSQGAVVLQTERSRGAQIRAATERAEGEMIFIAHADMTLAPDVLDRALKSFPGTCIPGGCVGARFSGHSVLLRILSSINELRARCLGISYGAQGQYVRRDWLMGEGGFPDIPLMEDVELSLRFKRKGRPFYLRGGVTASARRWAEEKRLLHLLLVAALTTWYVVLRAFKENVDTQRFYQRYYR